MTDRPIIFSGPMVLALLDGSKTQTRRLARRTTPRRIGGGHYPAPTIWQKVQPGDRLWVREAFRLRDDQDAKPPSQDWWKSGAWYFADDPALEPSGCGGGAGKLRPSIHMPRWASRLTLAVSEVRRQRVQDISRNDCGYEGFRLGLTGRGMPSPYDFERFWCSLHSKPGALWEDNPEVVALTFTVHKCNIDKMARDDA